jgi:anti-repressor protein
MVRTNDDVVTLRGPLVEQLITISQSEVGSIQIQTVNARELHLFLKVGTAFKDWFPRRTKEYDFKQGVDFTSSFSSIEDGGDGRQHFHISLDMAKELAMVERNDQGRKARQYFIECERRALQAVRQAPSVPQIPQTFAQALRLAAEQAEIIDRQLQQLEAAQPAIAFVEAVSDMTGLCYVGDVAKTLGYGPNLFWSWLKRDKIVRKDRMPFQDYLDRGWFKVVEREPYKDSSEEMHPTFTTMVTGKGQIALARKYPAAVMQAERQAA